MEFFDRKVNLPGERSLAAYLKGGGNGVAPVINSLTAANLTTPFSQGTTIAYVATGRFTLNWKSNPGTLLGFRFAFGDTTSQATVKGCTATRGVMTSSVDSTGRTLHTLEIDLWSSTFAAFDLATTSLLDLSFYFSTVRA